MRASVCDRYGARAGAQESYVVITLGRSRRLKTDLAAKVEAEGNFYCCGCGEPMKNYSTAHWIWCCIPGWGLIALLFKLKKCTKCGKAYPNRLLATR